MNVLVTPLDWGLGHATRCVPVINELVKQNHTVWIGSSGRALQLLKKEFPSLPCVELAPYAPIYGKSSKLILTLLPQIVKFFRAIREEHQQLQELVKVHRIEVVISDHRYGCYSKNTKNIIITHQVQFQFSGFWKWGGWWVNAWHHYRLKKFNEIWVPDVDGSPLSGKLSSKPFRNAKFVGLLSRFSRPRSSVIKKYDVLVLISGPEPQRSIFELLVKSQLAGTQWRTLVVKGIPEGSTSILQSGNQFEVDHLPTQSLQEAIESSKFIVARSGYSTLMDLARLKKDKLLFVPTPGQPEQEYLSRELAAQYLAFSVEQSKLSLLKDLVTAETYKGFSDVQEQELLQNSVSSI